MAYTNNPFTDNAKIILVYIRGWRESVFRVISNFLSFCILSDAILGT